jgi:hypothetical protein
MAPAGTPHIGRRALIGGAIGSLAAFAAGALPHPRTAVAASGDALILGETNSASGNTLLSRFGPNTSDITLCSADRGITSNSYAADGIGIKGETFGIGGTGIRAETQGHNSQIGLDADATFMVGEGIAVRGRTKNGIGVYAEATGGYALQVQGRAVFSRSGRSTVSAGQSSKTVNSFGIEPSAIVVATVQGNPAGVWVRNVSINAANDTFTIRLNKAAPSGGVTVGFFIVN